MRPLPRNLPKIEDVASAARIATKGRSRSDCQRQIDNRSRKMQRCGGGNSGNNRGLYDTSFCLFPPSLVLYFPCCCVIYSFSIYASGWGLVVPPPLVPGSSHPLLVTKALSSIDHLHNFAAWIWFDYLLISRGGKWLLSLDIPKRGRF
ncbi:hypothetical protein TSUD_54680 [Trifolium subterraneum]|uniref:Uncharacterized protein n=1 Tax=Trifolium subterraneum TaxID=3900 RepID=A0A2Z6M7Z2_TRISU|nr:hypothetical protein TSUD_54680 [Trifolium subterraneum]